MVHAEVGECVIFLFADTVSFTLEPGNIKEPLQREYSNLIFLRLEPMNQVDLCGFESIGDLRPSEGSLA